MPGKTRQKSTPWYSALRFNFRLVVCRFAKHRNSTCIMKTISELTPAQLRRAAGLKEQIGELQIAFKSALTPGQNVNGDLAVVVDGPAMKRPSGSSATRQGFNFMRTEIKEWITDGLGILTLAILFYVVWCITPGNPPEFEANWDIPTEVQHVSE